MEPHEVTILVDPDHPERNREVFIFKCDLDAPQEVNTQYRGFVIMVQVDRHFVTATNDDFYTARFTAPNVIKLKVPALPYPFSFGTDQLQSVQLGNDVTQGLLASATAVATDPLRATKIINLQFPDEYKLDHKTVTGEGPWDELHREFLWCDASAGSANIDPNVAGNQAFAMFKVARSDVPQIREYEDVLP